MVVVRNAKNASPYASPCTSSETRGILLPDPDSIDKGNKLGTDCVPKQEDTTRKIKKKLLHGKGKNIKIAISNSEVSYNTPFASY